ncbi:GlpF Glycerol uptake facilitator and related permeases (Major Intrinsic Protein Family) [Candidatus Pelagibacterales bacterium]
MINNKYLAEFVGTALLMMVITGSGIMGYDLSRGNAGIALLINCIATGIALFILITIFINVSGAHFNPLVTLVSWSDGEINNEVFVKYFLSQLMGALLGIIIAHIIFYLPIIQFSTKVRAGYPFWISEFISTLILLFVIKHFSNTNKAQIPLMVSLLVAGGYLFTSSTFFVNPVLTIARSFTDTFVGIYSGDIIGFVIAQLLATLIFVYFFKKKN